MYVSIGLDELIDIIRKSSTVRCHYDAVNFSQILTEYIP